MTLVEKELIVSRIIAGCYKCNIEDTTLLLKSPNRFQRYMAEEVYSETLYKAELDGSYVEDEYMTLLRSKNIWDDTKQKMLDGLTKDIEELKVGLFQSTFKSEKRAMIRRALQRSKDEQVRLHNILHEYDYLSAKGVAHMMKARYIIAASLHRLDGSKLYNENELWSASDYVVETVAEFVSHKKLTEPKIRELARTEPWRTVWMGRKSEASLFGIPAVDLTDEQRMLSIWSGVYDNVYEHPESPTDDVIQDDDMLDGWMIVQKRNRESQRDSTSNLISNEKIRNSEEVFIPCDTVEDARKIEALNDTGAAMIKRKRTAMLKEKGVVNEKDMPDSQMKIRAEFNRQFIESRKG
jgi:hypothetical protein